MKKTKPEMIIYQTPHVKILANKTTNKQTNKNSILISPTVKTTGFFTIKFNCKPLIKQITSGFFTNLTNYKTVIKES